MPEGWRGGGAGGGGARGARWPPRAANGRPGLLPGPRCHAHGGAPPLGRPYGLRSSGCPCSCWSVEQEAASGMPQRVEAERMHVAADAGHAVRDESASGKRALVLTGRGWARGRMDAAGRSVLSVRLRAAHSPAPRGSWSWSTKGPRCHGASTADAGRAGTCAGSPPRPPLDSAAPGPIPTVVATVGALSESTGSGYRAVSGPPRGAPAPPPATPGIWLPSPTRPGSGS